MAFRKSITIILLLPFTGAVSAQEPSGRLDLDVVARALFPRIVHARVAFTASDAVCPEDYGTVQISGGRWIHHRLIPPPPRPPASNWRGTHSAIDDETFLYQIESQTCRTGMTVRQQVRRDGEWRSLSVPRDWLPNLSLEERRELTLQRLERASREPVTQAMIDRWNAAREAIRSSGSLHSQDRMFSWGYPFENVQPCFEGIGEYRFEQTGVVFSFFLNLPAELNRFLIERTDLDDNRSQLRFSRDDCRFEFTIRQSILRDGQWVALPLAPIRPAPAPTDP
jgi:hypothetical protein